VLQKYITRCGAGTQVREFIRGIIHPLEKAHIVSAKAGGHILERCTEKVNRPSLTEGDTFVILHRNI
jgi:hypothetical protein